MVPSQTSCRFKSFLHTIGGSRVISTCYPSVSRVTSHSVCGDGIPIMRYTEPIMKAFTNETKVNESHKRTHSFVLMRRVLISSGVTDLANTMTACCSFMLSSHSSQISSPTASHPHTHQIAPLPSSHPPSPSVGLVHQPTYSWRTLCVFRLHRWSRLRFRMGKT
jgi:hypothetical protein